VVAIAHEVQLADAIDVDRRHRLPAPLRLGDALEARSHARRSRAKRTVELLAAIDGSHDRVDRDDLDPEVALADPAERLDDLVEGQDDVDVAGLEPEHRR